MFLCGRVKAADARRPNKLIRKAGSDIGDELEIWVGVSAKKILKQFGQYIPPQTCLSNQSLLSCLLFYLLRIKPLDLICMFLEFMTKTHACIHVANT